MKSSDSEVKVGFLGLDGLDAPWAQNISVIGWFVNDVPEKDEMLVRHTVSMNTGSATVRLHRCEAKNPLTIGLQGNGWIWREMWEINASQGSGTILKDVRATNDQQLYFVEVSLPGNHWTQLHGVKLSPLTDENQNCVKIGWTYPGSPGTGPKSFELTLTF